MKPKIKNAKVRGEIHAPDDLALLTQDMLEVELANGVIIDVGWYPEHDPKGEYGVTVFQKHPDKPLQEPFYTRSATEAVQTVERYAQLWADAPESAANGPTRRRTSRRSPKV